VRLLSNSAGAKSDSYRYDAFGNLLTSTGATANPFRFAGEEEDASLGLYYLRARYLDPRSGRFITGDPVLGNPRDPRTLNRYAYAGSDPVNRIDPLGTQDFSLAGISISIDIIGTLSSIAIAGYGIYKDVKDIQAKLKTLFEEIPKLKLNEKLTRAELRFRIIEINIGKGVDINLDTHLGEGSVGKSYEIVKDLVGGWGGKIVAFVWSYSAGEYMAEVLPDVAGKPGFYLSCEFNQYIFQTYQLQLLNGVVTKPFKPALQIIGTYLAYINFLELMLSTMGELEGDGAPAQPPSGCCKVP
jgi:RHS repeat-associated protein